MHARRYIVLCLAGCAGIALALRIMFFSISVTHLPVSSDESLTILQAEDIRHGELPLLMKGNPYEFPVESYLNAPFVFLLPRTALGARVVPAVAALAAMVLFLLLLFRLGPWRDIWPGILLVLFPSAYQLMVQAGYFIPQSTSIGLLCAGAMLLAVASLSSEKHLVLVALGSGLLAGLAFSNQMVSAAVTLGVAAVVCLRESGRKSLLALAGFSTGAVIGLVPYVAAQWLLPHAYEGVSTLRSWHGIRHLLLSPMLDHALHVGLGLRPCIYPDWKECLPGSAFLDHLPILVWLLCLLTVTVLRSWAFSRRLVLTRRISLQVNDLFPGISWLAVIAFVLSARSDAYTARYLLPLIWCYPFLWSHLYARSGAAWRRVLAVVTIGLVLLNLAAGVRLMHFWTRYPFADKETPFLDLRPALAYLRDNGITHCYASAWTAYRIDFETHGAIVAAQPYNERFPAWSTPFKDKVDAATNAAFVLTAHTYFPPDRFESHLACMQVDCRKEAAGHFMVYHDFRPRHPPEDDELLPPEGRAVTASHGAAEAGRLSDGIHSNYWSSGVPQEKGMWVQVDLPAPALVSKIALVYGEYGRHVPARMNILVRRGAAWEMLCKAEEGVLDKFAFRNGHPVYWDEARQTIWWPARWIEGVRVEIGGTTPGPCWMLKEIELYTPRQHPAESTADVRGDSPGGGTPGGASTPL